MSQGTIDDTDFPPDFFNVVNLMDVLEHLPDPGGALNKINAMLAPGGAVFIKVPNMQFLQFVTLVLAKSHLVKKLSFLGGDLSMNPREHLYNFSSKPLCELRAKHGFKAENALSFSSLSSGNSRKDKLKKAYSTLAWCAKTLSAGRVNLYPDMGILAIRVG